MSEMVKHFAMRGCTGGGARRVVLVLALVLPLGACSSDNMFSMFGPKEPDVPLAPAGQYPNLGTVAPEVKRPPVLDSAGQQRLQNNLVSLGKQNQERGEAAQAQAPAAQ